MLRFFNEKGLFLRRKGEVDSSVRGPDYRLDCNGSHVRTLVNFVGITLRLNSLILVTTLADVKLIAANALTNNIGLVKNITGNFGDLTNLHLSLSTDGPCFNGLPAISASSGSRRITPVSPLGSSVAMSEISFYCSRGGPVLGSTSFHFRGNGGCTLANPSNYKGSALLGLLLN